MARTASECQDRSSDHQSEREGRSWKTLTTVGIDLAKNVFSLHGVDGFGKRVLRRTVRRDELETVVSEAAGMRDWHGGLFGRTRVGAALRTLWPHGEIDGAEVRRPIARVGRTMAMTPKGFARR
jgi:hypothetical protein